MKERVVRAGTIVGPTETTDWQTPQYLLAPVRGYFGGRIPCDVATSEDNPTDAVVFYTHGGLDRPWPPKVFVNPPYGHDLPLWFEKIHDEPTVTVIALLPVARSEQGYFQRALHEANMVCWIRKRVDFIHPLTGYAVRGNPYANMFIGWNVAPNLFAYYFSAVGMTQLLTPYSRALD